MASIEAQNLSRDFEFYEKEEGFKGSIKNLFNRKKSVRHAVSNVSFQIHEGEIVGFLGPNGAGKTTTLKMLSGILHPTSGRATVNGFMPWERKNEFKRSFSFVAGQKSQLWVDLPANESLHLIKCIYEIPDKEYDETLNELVELFQVKDQLKVQVRRLSLGERMKMELIAALLHKPKVIFLDEPTIGLDILSQQNIRSFLKKYNEDTKATIILTSHYIKDIEELCAHTIIINEGRKVYDGQLNDVRKFCGTNKMIKLSFTEIIDTNLLTVYGNIVESELNKVTLEISKEDVNGCLLKVLNELPVADFTIEEVPIEQGIAMIFRNQKVLIEIGCD